MKSGNKPSEIELYALAFGLFLGLAILKFGNPVILNSKITPPVSASDFLNDPWPTHWANWCFLPLALAGAAIVWSKKTLWPASKWLWLLPLLWFGWQLFSAMKTVDTNLTIATFWQFFGCVTCYFLGTFLFGHERTVRWLLIGVLAAFTFCMMRAVDQRIFEFPQNHQALVEGERSGWTNFPPETLFEMKRENLIVTTNGVDVANPVILAKFVKGRVNGTLVYPNALAGLVLLLFPVAMVLAFDSTKRLRQAIRIAVITLVLFLGVVGFFWTGSKLGWLIAIVVGVVWLFRLKWAARFKWVTLIIILMAGLGIFALRFHGYFSAGATSASARFDYWHAALQTTFSHPWFGTGPGTFQRPYAKLKSPDSEMARLTHNDYLEQFSDSGILGGIFYLFWTFLAMLTIGKKLWRFGSPVMFGIFVGLLGWFAQGIGEFSLYIQPWLGRPLLYWGACWPGQEMK
ncbi:MAG: O-antigen ligase family protein [Limisphaerales bacterium]